MTTEITIKVESDLTAAQKAGLEAILDVVTKSFLERSLSYDISYESVQIKTGKLSAGSRMTPDQMRAFGERLGR